MEQWAYIFDKDRAREKKTESYRAITRALMKEVERRIS